ncbi:ABC transporter permease [Paenibacillus antri]|uniref:ABC transporter permease n=2 Tax=Paenibacillus antri TaxID=2582848 RepID=A0A5R9GIK0_9BACL|nr:ABC transporter permease [Paenibacillus antri]
MAQMEYRFNFLMGIGVETAFLFAKMLYVIVVYQADVHIAGLSPDSILMFVGTYTMMTGLYMGLFAMNFYQIPEQVLQGKLDLLLTKPVSLQFMLTLRRVDFGLPLPNVIGGIAMIAIGWGRTGIPVTIGNIAGFMFFLVMAVALTYALFLIPQLTSFWFGQIRGLNSIADAVWDFNNMPMAIYKRWIQQVGIFVLPIFMITNFSPLFVMDRLEVGYFAWAIAAPLLLLAVARLIWSAALRNYSSAN